MFKSVRKVLVVDDETDLLELVSDRLNAGGYEVLTARSGLLGIEKAFRENPNLILLDVSMPNMDGWQVLRMLREDDRTKQLPVIMLTAQGETTSHFKAKELNATDYFVKPFDSEELLNFIERYI